MVRPLRIEYEDAFYHVMNRGRGRQWIFPNPDYYSDFLTCIDESHKRFGIEIHSYCLMGNHYHLLVKTPRGNLSRAMRHIDGVYTQRHNRRKKTDGSLFRGRYKAIVVDASSHLLQVSRYIHRNPIDLSRPIVDKLEDYPWSSYAAYIKPAEPFQWLNRDTVYGAMGSFHRYRAYRAFVEEGTDQETASFYNQQGKPAIWGDKAFKKIAYGKANTLSIEVDKKGLKEVIPLMDIIEAVSKHFHIPVETIQKAKRGSGSPNVPRWIAMRLCQEIGGAKLTEIADVFQVGHYSTVSQSIWRLKRLIKEKVEVGEDLNTLSQDLTP